MKNQQLSFFRTQYLQHYRQGLVAEVSGLRSTKPHHKLLKIVNIVVFLKNSCLCFADNPLAQATARTP